MIANSGQVLYFCDPAVPFCSPPPAPLPAVHRQYNEDLFESTKMTFGEHLEELRHSLVK